MPVCTVSRRVYPRNGQARGRARGAAITVPAEEQAARLLELEGAGLAQPYYEARETEAAGSAQPAGGPQQEMDWAGRAEALWRCGRLHLIRSAPKKDHTWRMTIAPGVNVDAWEEEEMHKDYYVVVLAWCGDRLYHHQALLKAAQESSGYDMGALHMIYRIEERRQTVS